MAEAKIASIISSKEEHNMKKNFVTNILLLLAVLLLAGLVVFAIIQVRAIRSIDFVALAAESDNSNDSEETTKQEVSSIRIPGKGSQKDYSENLPFAKIIVHDDEPANEKGYFDRTVQNTSDPNDIGMDDQFAVPDGWFVERDFSAKNDAFVSYMTVKPLVSTTAEDIRSWATENHLEEGVSYEITSVIVIDDQECSVRGLDANRVRTNIYVGENFVYQLCPPTIDN